MKNDIPFDRKFIFYKADFSKCVDESDEPKVYEFDLFSPVGITENGSLVVLDFRSQTLQKNGRKPKKIWINKDYFNSSNSPIWFETINKSFGFIIREVFPNQDVTQVLTAAYNISNKYAKSN